MTSNLALTFFASKDDNIPGRGEMTWEVLIEGLSQPRSTPCTLADCPRGTLADCPRGTVDGCPHKNGVAWSPATWPPGATRAKATVEGVALLVVDIDHVKTDGELAAIYERILPWRHFVHASHSDVPGDRCVRVGLAVSRSIHAREFPRVLRTALQMLELPGDPQTKDASRLFYLPSRPHDACGEAVDGTGYLFAHGDGKVLDVDAILALAGPDNQEFTGLTEFVMPDFVGAPELDKLEEAARVLGEAWPDDDRHPAQLALAGALARAGWPVDLIASFCARVAEIDEPGNPKHVQLAPGSARSSFEKARRGEAVAGWPTVIEYVGEEAVSTARRVLGMDTTPQADPSFVAQMTSLAIQQKEEAIAEAIANPPPAPAGVNLKSSLKSAQKRLAGRKDADSLRDAELIKFVNHGDLLIDDPGEPPCTTLALAAVAVARTVPTGTTAEQIVRELSPSAGHLVHHVPEIVEQAMAAAAQMPNIFARAATTAASTGDGPINEFVLDTSGPRAGAPAAANQHNFNVAMSRFGVVFHFDVFARKKLIEVGEQRVIVQDEHITSLMFRCEREFGFYPPKDKFHDFVTDAAHMNAYHPVLVYLKGLPRWDGVPRVEEWLINYAGVADSPYVRAISRLVLVAAVRRVRQPGCKFDEMLILEGEQGTLKSSALKVLCPERSWFTDDFKLGLDTKTQMERTAGKWIVEAGELKGMSASDQNEMKSNLSRSVDEARMAYGRETSVVPRQFIFIGTTNEAQYLKDPTGDRRYWPVRILHKFDLDKLLADRDQIWAEAVALDLQFPQEEFIRLAPELYSAAAEEQEKRRVIDPIQMALDDALGGAVGAIRAQDVWKLLHGYEDKLPSSADQRQIAAALRMLGFEPERTSRNSVRGTYYIRGSGPQRDITLTVRGNNGQYKVVGINNVTTPSQVAPRIATNDPTN